MGCTRDPWRTTSGRRRRTTRGMPCTARRPGGRMPTCRHSSRRTGMPVPARLSAIASAFQLRSGRGPPTTLRPVVSRRRGLPSPEPRVCRGVEPQPPPDQQSGQQGHAPAQPDSHAVPDEQPDTEDGGGHHDRPPPPSPAVAPLLAFLVAAALVGGLGRGARPAAPRVADGLDGSDGSGRHCPDLLGQLLDPGSAQALDRQSGAAGIGLVATAGPVMLAALVGHHGLSGQCTVSPSRPPAPPRAGAGPRRWRCGPAPRPLASSAPASRSCRRGWRRPSPA